MERDYEKNLARRELSLEVREVEKQERTLEFPFSSEQGVMRYFGNEVLDHSKKSVDLGRLNDGAPVLWNHDAERVIGVVEKAWIDESKKRGYASVRFSKEEFASSVLRDIKDGIIRNISVGYQIKEMEQRGDDFVATSWEPYEVTVTAIGADNSIGIGRSATNNDKIDTMVREDRSNDSSAASVAPSIPPQVEMTTTPDKELEVVRSEVDTQKVIKAERSRIQEIQTVSEKYGLKDLGDQYIREERSVEEFNAAVLREWKPEAIQPEAESADVGLTEKEARSFSFLRALNYLANPGDRNAREKAAFEIEVSEAAAAKRGKPSAGITLPNDVLRRDLKTSPATAGGNLVETELDSANFIDLLRNASALNQAGARVLTGLEGNLAIPKQSGAATAYWVAESGSPTESQQTIAQVSLIPRTVGAYTDISRKLILQSSIDVEQMVRSDLASVIALEIDRAALYGTGAANQPLGLHNVAGIGAQAFGAGNNPTFAEAVGMESDVATANALVGNLSYITNATIRGNMKVRAKDTGSGLFLWTGDNTVNGYPAYLSNQVEAGDVWYGNWSDLIIGYWSGLDLMADPYTHSTSGTIRIRVLQDCDVAVRHAGSFCLGA
jgi:HK97 family phage major capsid protein/HK97 family phage prohead protease